MGEFAYLGDWQLFRAPLIRIGVGASILFLTLLVGQLVQLNLLQAAEKELRSSFANMTEQIVGQAISDPIRAMAMMREAPSIGSGLLIPNFSATQLFEALSSSISTEFNVTLEELDFRLATIGNDKDRITGKAETDSFDSVEKLKGHLKGASCVEGVAVSRQKKTRNSDRVEFNLSIDVKCGPGMTPLSAREK